MNQIEEIAEIIVKRNKKQEFSHIGFLDGSMGEIFFLYYYSLINPSYKEHAESALYKLLEGLPNFSNLPVYTYCNGLAGLGASLHILDKSGFIETSQEIFEDIDLILEHALSKEIIANNYDFLHGSIGIGIYFLKLYKINPKKSLLQIEKLLDYLEKVALFDKEDGIKWGRIKNSKVEYDISLSHGMSSIIVFLSQVTYLEEIDNTRVIKMLNMAINYVLSQRIDVQQHGSYFPYVAIESSDFLRKSRLAWCYGDLGIAIALWQAGNALDRNDIRSFSIEVLRYNSTRKDLESNLVMDAGICHGTAGISQIFYRMYKETQIEQFLETYEYWNDQTKSMSYHKVGLAGYMAFDIRHNKWYNTRSLLEGISGIGLSLLSTINADWDEAILLSFK